MEYELEKIRNREILYVESTPNYIKIHTQSEKYMVQMPLKTIKNMLGDKKFHQTHQSYILNNS
ncbi:MAG: LytTR family transcriptional regulator [bacterium]|nr:LytTR family transcriptional regulator [bacterium]